MSKRVLQIFSALCLSLCLSAALASSATAAFDIKDFTLSFSAADGSDETQAGAHPFEVGNTLAFETVFDALRKENVPDGALKDLRVELPAGQVGAPEATPRCSGADFLDIEASSQLPHCSNASALGVITVELEHPGTIESYPVYNLIPAPGTAAKFGFIAATVPIAIELRVSDSYPYNVIATVSKNPQVLPIYATLLRIWGNPADPAHDPYRGSCLFHITPGVELVSKGNCPANIAEVPFITLPRSCTGALPTTYEASSWQGGFDAGSTETTAMNGCSRLSLAAQVTAQPTTKAAQSPTGLDFAMDINDEGINSSKSTAHLSDIKKAVVTLPEGFSTNPSLAEGLEVCTEAQLNSETAFSAPGAGCPNASKVGTVEVETPLLDESVNGSLFIAKPYENPFGSLIALYMVIKNPQLGVVVRQAMKVESDPVTGQLTTVADNLPQLPFSHFRLHFREGARSPLASPPACGTYNVKAELTPWSGGAPLVTNSAFQIITGPDAGPCPSGGLPPFRPGLIAGTLNNAAGRFSPFNVRLFRTDSEQEFTRFSIKLPPGIVGILAGIPYCPEAGIAQAIGRTGPHGGQEELDAPSCPAASEIGHTLAGAGVGPSLAYAPGKVYLAGPYKGTAFSLVAITAARVGPFDLGTVVIRQGFKVDRETAEVFIDATESDPIPHIIKGIPVHARDIRAYVDRSKFVFNPTNCERTSTASTLLGSGLDFGSAVDDRPVTVSTPFQAADCAALRFDPKLKLALKGSTKRGGHPAFRAELNMKGGPERGEANIARAQVTLPRSAFLENAHIKTICTRVQFRADQCPPGSIYGYAKAITPVLSEPVEGPVYLRSSEHQLPDLVASLHSEKITVDVVGRIDSLNGRIRNTFEAVPDAPVTKFVLTMQGGKKGLIVNSTNLCRGAHKAIAEFTAQNGREKDFHPAVKAKCGKSGKAKRQKRKR